MSFYSILQEQTHQARSKMLSAPVIERCMRGDITSEMYIAFLTQAYYHVNQTVPLLMCAGSRLPTSYEWVRQAIAEYIDEEYGHQEWILNDIQHCGGNAESVRNGQPGQPIELMIAYLYHQIERVNPMCIFGMVHVLEGTSVTIATPIAEALQGALGLDDQATSYLRSHGALDMDHIKFFASLMDRTTNPQDQKDIIHTARTVYSLYGEMLCQLSEPSHEPAK
ncbi:TenA family transcriptional regulator [Candidatus Symbiopectobacterium sp. NZEC135]|uniref:TenA family transcriptional regulator n=1 Tax=Candidatus Symbiopectobacterium sp. NZEC135 TaxID=2820471 RepID=UPI002226B712|nr:iron-containing redox enzyme family protein [Candidatus Symbiopectobacterium sp. NZEC135]MCW2479409.1 iron-containing redox enzyme family protein [Candidatus Symbiopectobacterium sp. NZEC135]